MKLLCKLVTNPLKPTACAHPINLCNSLSSGLSDLHHCVGCGRGPWLESVINFPFLPVALSWRPSLFPLGDSDIGHNSRNGIIYTHFSSVDIEDMSSFWLGKFVIKHFKTIELLFLSNYFLKVNPWEYVKCGMGSLHIYYPQYILLNFTTYKPTNSQCHELWKFLHSLIYVRFFSKKSSLLMQIALSDNFHFHVHDYLQCWKVYHLFKTFAFSSVYCLCPCPVVIDFLIHSFTRSC